MDAVQQRRQLYRNRRMAWSVLALSALAVGLWEVFGDHPADFGFRFSPMYTFSATGIVYWGLVTAFLGSLVLLHRFYMGKEILLPCPRCEACVSTKADWVCPHCEQENTPTRGGPMNILYTVLTRCRHCGKSPDAVCCPQCGADFDLAESGGRAHPARVPTAKDAG